MTTEMQTSFNHIVLKKDKNKQFIWDIFCHEWNIGYYCKGMKELTLRLNDLSTENVSAIVIACTKIENL